MLNRLKQYDWRNFNYSLVIIVVILCLVSAFTLKLAGGVEKGAGYMRGQLIGMVMGLFIVAFLSVLDYHFICRFVAIYFVFGVVLVLRRSRASERILIPGRPDGSVSGV